MGLEHPAITRTLRTGYPYKIVECVCFDGLGNEVCIGDEVFELDDEIYLIDEISLDAREILERHGAVRRVVNG